MGERELATEPPAEATEPDPPAPLIVLSRPDFEAAVRQALRDYARPDALAASPLLRSRLLADRGGTGDPEALRGMVREAVATLAASPRDDKFSRAVARTYLDPAPTQEAAAEWLGLPFCTYRYQLAAGIDRITGWRWRREIGGLEG